MESEVWKALFPLLFFGGLLEFLLQLVELVTHSEDGLLQVMVLLFKWGYLLLSVGLEAIRTIGLLLPLRPVLVAQCPHIPFLVLHILIISPDEFLRLIQIVLVIIAKMVVDVRITRGFLVAILDLSLGTEAGLWEQCRVVWMFIVANLWIWSVVLIVIAIAVHGQ